MARRPPADHNRFLRRSPSPLLVAAAPFGPCGVVSGPRSRFRFFCVCSSPHRIGFSCVRGPGGAVGHRRCPPLPSPLGPDRLSVRSCLSSLVMKHLCFLLAVLSCVLIDVAHAVALQHVAQVPSFCLVEWPHHLSHTSLRAPRLRKRHGAVFHSDRHDKAGQGSKHQRQTTACDGWGEGQYKTMNTSTSEDRDNSFSNKQKFHVARQG